MIRKVFVTVTILSVVWNAIALGAAAEDESSADDLRLESDLFFVSQPGTNRAADEATRAATTPANRASARNSYARLARAPNMFGDGLSTAGVLMVQAATNSFSSDVPLAGGRNQKVGENNKPIPMDRVYFVYNGFQNAVSTGVGPPLGRVFTDANLNRYTLGFEKMFLDGQCSLDVRMPLTDSLSSNNPGFSFNSGNVGNLALFLKHLCFSTDTLAVAAGVGCALPTGSDITGQLTGQPFRVRNEAVHLLPYIGFLSMPNDSWFLQGFLEMDLAANGNPVIAQNAGVNFGRLTEQNQLHADLSVGRWLFQKDSANYLNGVAGIFEMHYTTSVQDADTVAFAIPTTGFGTFSNPANRTDVLNLTGGLHFQLTALSNLRVGCVVPLRNAPNRQFDTEIQVSFNRFF